MTNRKTPEESLDRSGKSQKRTKEGRTSPDRETPPFEPALEFSEKAATEIRVRLLSLQCPRAIQAATLKTVTSLN